MGSLAPAPTWGSRPPLPLTLRRVGPNPPPTLAAVPPVLGLPLLQQWARTAAPAVPGAVSLSGLQSSFLSTSDCSLRARNKTPNTRSKIGKLFFDILTIKIIRA